MTAYRIAYQITEWREKTIEANSSEGALELFRGIVASNPGDVLYGGSTIEARRVADDMTFCRGIREEDKTDIQTAIDTGKRPSYWKGCPSTYNGTCCTEQRGHTGRNSFLGERYWIEAEVPSDGA